MPTATVDVKQGDTANIRREKTAPALFVDNWAREDIPRIYRELEVPNWPPWQRASVEQLSRIRKIYPEGQLIIRNENRGHGPIAMMSLNRIYVGEFESLRQRHWQEIAGLNRTYEDTYMKDGNAIQTMWINVLKGLQGGGYARALLLETLRLADQWNVTVIGAFRPTGWGQYDFVAASALNAEEFCDLKRDVNGKLMGFEEYCNLKRDRDGLPEDGWLRNLVRNGMRPLFVDYGALEIKASFSEFLEYRETYKPERWTSCDAPGLFGTVSTCGEAGFWLVKYGEYAATYHEPKLWGVFEKEGPFVE